MGCLIAMWFYDCASGPLTLLYIFTMLTYNSIYLFANYLIYISPSVFKLTYSFDDFSVSRTKRRGKYRKKDAKWPSFTLSVFGTEYIRFH